MGNFFQELKRRKVFRVGAVYAVVSWVIIQVADTLFPALQLPDWTITFITVLLILGFFPVLIAAWAYEVTTEGIKPDSGFLTPAQAQGTQNQGLVYATFFLVLLVAGFQIGDRFIGTTIETRTAPQNDSIVTRVAVQMPEEQFFDGTRGDFDMSADGTLFVYRGVSETGESMLWLRRWDELSGRPIQNTESPSRPKISPDGSEVVFNSRGAVRVASLQGGLSRVLTQSGNDTPNWSPDGNWVYFRNSSNGISRVPSAGGAEETIVSPNQDRGEEVFIMPEVLPGNHLVYSVLGEDGITRLQSFNAETGQTKYLTEGGYPIYSRSGHLLFQVQDGATLMAAPFDIEILDLAGPALPIADELLLVGAGNVGNVAVSETGRLIYRTGGASGEFATPVWVDRKGDSSDFISGWSMLANGGVGIPSLSPQGDRIVVAINEGGIGSDIWIGHQNGQLSRITFGEQDAFVPTWTPDGLAVMYAFARSGQYAFWTKRADGSGSPQLLLESEHMIRRGFISADGEWMLYRDLPGGAGAGRIRAFKIGANDDALTLVDADFDISAPALSPDGDWLAYSTNESGQWEVYVQPFPDVDSGRWQVSVNGGSGPAWAHSMQEMFYVNGSNELVVIDIKPGASFSWGAEQRLFSLDEYRTSRETTMYDVDSDDQRFLMMQYGERANTELILVDNWYADFDRSRMSVQ